MKKIKRNINYDKLSNIIKQIKLDEFLNQRKLTLNDTLSESAINISGGQAQRIGIARALYNSDDFLIFDEAFNNLDKHSINNLTEIIDGLKNNYTILVISHIDEPLELCVKFLKISQKKKFTHKIKNLKVGVNFINDFNKFKISQVMR